MKQSFRTQFGKTKILETGAEKGREKVLLVPGFGEGITHTKKLLGALAAKDYDAISFSQPRKRGDKGLNPVERQAEIVKDVIKERTSEGEKVHAVAHSLGGAAVLKAAQDTPEKFESITILQTAGAVGHQGFGELLGRTGKKVVKNQFGAARGQDSAIYVRNGRYVANADNESRTGFSTRVNNAQLASGATLARNLRLAVNEAGAAGQYDMTDDVKKVTELGIPIHLVKAHSDEMFDSVEVDERSEPLLEHGISISSVADPTARHDTSWMQAEQTAKIIDQTIKTI